MTTTSRMRFHVTVLLFVAACQGGDDKDIQPQPASDPDATLYAHRARDVFVASPVAALALESRANGYAGGYLTHSMAIEDGVITLVPKHYDRARQQPVIGGSLTLETTRIGRGDQLASLEALSSLATSTSVKTYRGLAVEQVQNVVEGIEQSWSFDALPAGTGDLDVVVAVRDQHFVVANERGLHFASDRGLGFAYSHATWRDANGSDWEIEARYENGAIVMTIPEAILDETTFPAVLDPTVSAELYTDTPATGSAGTNTQRPDVAGSGSDYLVVWQDSRDGDDNIYGTRVSSAGAVLDAQSIKINTAAGTQAVPKAAFVGNGWVVAWEDHVATGNSNIVAAFVDTSGAVTQLGNVAATSANEIAPAIAGRGNEALLAWQSGTDIFAARFSGGAFGAAFAVATTADSESAPAVAANPGGDYLVAFVDTQAGTSDDIRGQLVTAAGALNGAVFNIAAFAGSQVNPAADFNGTNFVVVYGNLTDLWGSRVSPTGTVLDATGVQINSSTASQSLPDVSCTTGGSCFVTWQDNRTFATTSFDVFGALVDGNLGVTTNNIVVSGASRAEQTPAIALSGTQWFAAWTDSRAIDVVSAIGTRISSAGAVVDTSGILLPRNWTRDTAPQLVSSSNVWGMFFDTSQLPDFNIVVSRFTVAIPPVQLDSTPKVISNATASQLAPSAALVGANWIAVWQDSRSGLNRDIYASRVAPNTGAPLDGSGIAISTAGGDQLAPKIASAGTSALAVWGDSRNGNFDIFGAVIDSSGAVTKADIPICVAAADQTRPAVAFDSVHQVYLVVWGDAQSGGGDIHGARIDVSGNVLDANCGAIISGAAGAQGSPALAFGNGQFFVAWEDRRTDSQGDIFGARVTTAGSIAVLDPNGVAVMSMAGVQQNEPSVGLQNTNFLITWTDGRNLATTGLDIFGARYLSTNTVETPFAISTNAGDEHNSNVTNAAGSTPILITYTKARPDLDSLRVQMRQLTFSGGNGQPCTANGQCGTGFCVDSKCCDTACGGNTLTDCQACSVAHGGQVDGTCGILAGGNLYLCRNYAQIPGTCDLREYCDGVNPLCPPDVGQNQGLACKKTDGTIGVCPANDVTGSPHTCR